MKASEKQEDEDERPKRRGYIAHAIVALAARLVSDAVAHIFWR